MRLANDPKPEEVKAPEAVADTEAMEPVEEIEGFSEQNARDLSALIKDFLSSYAKKPPEVSTRQWLHDKLKQELPDKSEEEITAAVDEIVSDVETFDKNLDSINKACASGSTKEAWLSDTLQEAAVGFSMNEFGEYLAGIDQAMADANAAMRDTIMTKAGLVSQNPNLDGFIAEQHAVNTFNVDAALKKSKYQAERLVPQKGTFGKNSVDIRIFDKNTGRTVQRFQAKFFGSAEKSIKALDPSRYGNQRGLVPKGHADPNTVKENLPKGSQKTVTDTLGGTDKVDVESKPLSKREAERYRDNAQKSGRVPDKISWNSYEIKQLTMDIGHQAAIAGVHAAALGAGMDMAVKVMQGEKIDGEKVIETAINTGADTGVKAATAGALKVGVERNMITFIPKSGVKTITNSLIKAGVAPNLARHFPYTMMACAAIENLKALSKFSKGELTATQTLDYMGRGTVSIIGSIAGSAVGGAITAGTVAAILGVALTGPVGIVAGFVGGVVGAVAGSGVAKVAYEATKTVVKTAASVVTSVAKTAYSAAKSAIGGVCSFVGGLFS